MSVCRSVSPSVTQCFCGPFHHYLCFSPISELGSRVTFPIHAFLSPPYPLNTLNLIFSFFYFPLSVILFYSVLFLLKFVARGTIHMLTHFYHFLPFAFVDIFTWGLATLSVTLSVRGFASPLVHQSVDQTQSVGVSIHQSVDKTVRRFVGPSVCWSNSPSICRSIGPNVTSIFHVLRP